MRRSSKVSIAVAGWMLALATGSYAQSAAPWALANFSDRLEVYVVNPGDTPLHTLATVDVAAARAVAPGFPGTMAVVADQNERTRFLPSQVDAGAGDEKAGALVFAVELAPHAQRTLQIYYSNTLHETLPWPKRVHATHSYGYNQATAAIESERIGYRTYGGFFFDVQAHEAGQSGLFNSLLGYASIVAPPVEGQDIIHLGDTLGLGGIFLREGDAVYRPPVNTPDYAHRPAKPMEPQYRVLSEGPLRALVEVMLPHWTIGEDEVAVRGVYEMRADEESVRCHVWVTPLHVAHRYQVGAGIRDLPQEHLLEQPEVVAVEGRQEARVGIIGLGLGFDASQARRSGTLTTGEGGNRIVVFAGAMDQRHPATLAYQIAAAWQGSGFPSPAQHIVQVLERERREPVLRLVQHETTPHPDKLTSEPK